MKSNQLTHRHQPSEVAQQRYSRLACLEGWSPELQNKLKQTSVIIDSCFEQTIRYLAATGIGTLRLFGQQTLLMMDQIKRLNPEVSLQCLSTENDSLPDTILWESSDIAILSTPQNSIANLLLNLSNWQQQTNSKCLIAVNFERATIMTLHKASQSLVNLDSIKTTACSDDVIMCAVAIQATKLLMSDNLHIL